MGEASKCSDRKGWSELIIATANDDTVTRALDLGRLPRAYA